MYALSTVYRNPMVEDFFRPLMRMANDRLSPRESVQDTETAYILSVELPGYEQDEINVSVKDSVLSIDAQHESESEGARRHFHRSFTLDAIDEDAIAAAYRNGILSVTLPKQADTEARRIEIAI